VSEPNIEVFSEGRGQEPWEQDPYARRVIRGSNYAICGMLDTADLATLVVSAVNGRAYTPPPLLPGMPARRGARPWRVGTKVGRTIYDGSDQLIGVMDTPAIAARVVAAVNERG
jgi:hypothetical protein